MTEMGIDPTLGADAPDVDPLPSHDVMPVRPENSMDEPEERCTRCGRTRTEAAEVDCDTEGM